MNLTNEQLEEIIKEEFDTIISEDSKASEGRFVAVYRAYLMNKGEEDVLAATESARVELEKLLDSPLEWATSLIGSINKKAASNIKPSKYKYRRPRPVGPSPMERSPLPSVGDE